MRELKFRAWDERTKEMVYSKPMPDFGFWKWVAYDSDTVSMQFTGLLDKNGKEIYEGDILKGTRYGSECYEAVKWVCGYDGDHWPVAGFAFELDELAGTEVIGNIYENPELLTNKS